jgi:hypothetical protein
MDYRAMSRKTIVSWIAASQLFHSMGAQNDAIEEIGPRAVAAASIK